MEEVKSQQNNTGLTEEEEMEVSIMQAPIDLNFTAEGADAVFDAIVNNPAVPDDIKKDLYFLQCDQYNSFVQSFRELLIDYQKKYELAEAFLVVKTLR